MPPNPVLRKLGFSDADRLVIIHTDDIGMCQASVQAFADLYDFGLISSGAVMVPCPWFYEAARFARQHPQADLGVHLTLTCEWQTYRWPPLSTRDPASGLIDEEGCFYRSTAQARQYGRPEAVQAEIEAQVERAVRAGLAPTHADTHMGVLAAEAFLPGYVRLAVARRLPAMLFRWNEGAERAAHLPPEAAQRAAFFMNLLEELGLPLMDNLVGMPLDQPDHQLELAKHLFSNLPPGITHFILHPSIDTPELRAITPDWPSRVANYYTFLSEELRDHIRSIGVQVIGYRALQNLMPDPASTLAALDAILANP